VKGRCTEGKPIKEMQADCVGKIRHCVKSSECCEKNTAYLLEDGGRKPLCQQGKNRSLSEEEGSQFVGRIKRMRPYKKEAV
jgi:hypothetical protein